MERYLLKSRGEFIVSKILEKYNYYYKYELPFVKWVTPDFCIINNGLKHFIEYDGRQHYQPVKCFGGICAFMKQLAHDIYERVLCKMYHIPLLRIKYNLTDLEIEQKIVNFLGENDFGV